LLNSLTNNLLIHLIKEKELMKAAVWYGGEDIRVQNVNSFPINERDVKIKVEYCGICGTDVHIIKGEFPLWIPPAIMGHEYSGIVVDIGKKVSNVSVGDRVTVDPSGNYCGRCDLCREGKTNLCVNRKILRGAFAEYAVVEDRIVYKIPDSVSFKKATLIEPLSCVLHAVDLANIKAGEKAVVLGAGPIGLLLIHLLRHFGISKIIVSEPVQKRREYALKLGADVAINPFNNDLKKVVGQFTNNLGAHLVFDACGSPKLFNTCIDLARTGGKCVMIGISPPKEKISITPYQLFSKELKIIYSYMRLNNYDRVINLLTTMDVEPIITNCFKLEDVLSGIKAVEKKEEIKPLVRPFAD